MTYLICNEDYDPHQDGIQMFREDKLLLKSELTNACYKIDLILHERPKGVLAELNTFRKYAPLLIEAVKQAIEIKDSAVTMMKRYITDCEDKSGKRWTEEEDNILIDLITDESTDKMSMFEIATTLGRTISAIKTRLSVLVGRKRLTQKVVGRFIGNIDGEDVKGNIEGIVIKDA